MSKQWYMTVGYPGGEFAWDGGKPLPRGTIPADQPRRRCPPDVVEWLEAEMHIWPKDGNYSNRMKVPGGWYYDLAEEHCPSHAFVPVPGTANITVLEASHD